MKVGSDEDEDDSPTADIKAAVQGVIDNDLAEETISSHVTPGSSENNKEVTSLVQINHEQNFKPATGGHNASSQPMMDHHSPLEEMNHNDVQHPQHQMDCYSANVELQHHEKQPTVPKIKLVKNTESQSTKKVVGKLTTYTAINGSQM